jgi:hypothetical protein
MTPESGRQDAVPNVAASIEVTAASPEPQP